MIWYGGYDINVDTRGSRPGLRIMFLRFWKSTLKTYVRKKDVDFLKLQLWTGSVVLVSMERGCCQNAVQKCTLLNISSHSRVHFIANWLCQFVQMGHAKQLTRQIFWLVRENWWYKVWSIYFSSVTTTTKMDTNQGCAHLRRVKHRNLSPHDIPPRGGPIAMFFSRLGTNCPI